MQDYHYTACGLDNVLIVGLEPCKDEEGQETWCIPNINGLHRAIAQMIVRQKRGIAPKEMRFLRTELGLTQAELAARLLVDAQTIGRWERSETPIDLRSDLLLRMLVGESMKMPTEWTLSSVTPEQLAPTAKPPQIKIDGSDPSDYKQAA